MKYMYQTLQYPFDSQQLLRKRKAIRKELLAKESAWLDKNIAILGGSTTHDIKDMMEIFLLNQGIRPSFYESEYAQFWQDAMFGNPALNEFYPDIIYIHTSNRNITAWPEPTDSTAEVGRLIDQEFNHFSTMWEKLSVTYHCPIIQNNFDYPFYRLLGNRDAVDIHGRVHFVAELNSKIHEYARSHEGFFVHDINCRSADYG